MDESMPAPDKMAVIEALRAIERLSPSEAARAVLRGTDGGWVHHAHFDAIGLYRFPSEEFEGLDWPALVLHATLEREDRETLEAWFAVYFDADGDMQASSIGGLPEAGRAITARPAMRPLPPGAPDPSPSGVRDSPPEPWANRPSRVRPGRRATRGAS